MAGRKIDEVTGTETTGHSWDGIEELNTPMPRWWLWTLYATIVWGVIYTIAFPAWPLISSATQGLVGYSTRGRVADQLAAAEAANAGLFAQLEQAELAALGDDPDLKRFAEAAGKSIFINNCAQCHGAGGAGSPGYPNLNDDAWLWGGGIEDIAYTVRHGIRNEQDPDARYSQMPAFGEILSDEEIAALVAHVRRLSGNEAEGDAEAGAVLFAENCASCHGEAATGDRSIGAPNLTDQIWLYGGDAESVRETITNSRFGVMPPWAGPGRLSEAEVRSVAAYVHQLGGGE